MKPSKIIAAMLALLCTFLYTSCEEGEQPLPHAKKYPADVAVAWMKLQCKLVKTTPGFAPGVASRAFAYSGVSLYEAISPGMPGYRSLVGMIGGPTLKKPEGYKYFHWPASANAALAYITRDLFPTTSAANKTTIDSLENAFNIAFESEIPNASILTASADFGREVAQKVFEWSKTDGGHEGYKPQPNTYVPPVGPGLWVPTPPAFAPAAVPYSGKNRTFTPGLTSQTQPTTYPIPAYSEDTDSDFYKMVNELYIISLTLTPTDIAIAKTWADIPGNFNGPTHFTNIATQLVVAKKLKLDEAALLYAKHGIALNDAGISVFETKYRYNLIRPISYIRSVIGHAAWNTVIPTPPHPEFTSAHAAVGRASSVVLESFFGKHCSVVDKTHESLYGTRTYSTLEEYAIEAAWSRILAGIHYKPSATAGLEQGRKVGDMVNKLPFRHGSDK